MARHDRRRVPEKRHTDTPFKKPGNVIIVSNPENGRLKNGRHSRKPMKKGTRPDRKRQAETTSGCNIPRPVDSPHDRIMEICGWMRDDGFISDKLYQDIYKPASDDNTEMLRDGIRTHMKGRDKKLMSYLRMIRDIIEEMDTGASSAR